MQNVRFAPLFLFATLSLRTLLALAGEDHMGEYPIGRDAIDASLPDGTELQIEFWYPAVAADELHPSKVSPAFLFSPALKAALVEYMGMPRMAISTKEKGRGLRGATLAKGPWPLVVFSHGFASFSSQNNRQAEALAQAGYIIAALSHPGESLTTEYADGRVVPIDDNHPALKYMGKRAKKSQLLAEAREMNAHLKPLANATSGIEYLTAMQALRSNTLFGLYQTSAETRRRHLVHWLQSVVAKNAADQRSDILAAVDWQRIALYGHSLGGVVSVATSETLRNQGIAVSAVVNLDAPPYSR